LTVIDEDAKKWLRVLLENSVFFHEPMARHTSFRAGGPADAFAVPGDLTILKKLVRGLTHRNIRFLVIGNGTNLLVKDSGFHGVIIVLKKALNQIRIDSGDGIVKAMAGAPLSRLCRFALENGLGGMNFALGIPGTVGGAIATNAGTRFGSVGDVLKRVTVVFPDGEIGNMKRETLRFSYRQLLWENDPVDNKALEPAILCGYVALFPENPEKLKKEAREIVMWRKKHQPSRFPSAGCFFKNPVAEKTAGQLIDLAGMKGKSFGGAEISSRHANFIVNRNNASASDILTLMKMIQDTVWEKFNIMLEPEVRIVGD